MRGRATVAVEILFTSASEWMIYNSAYTDKKNVNESAFHVVVYVDASAFTYQKGPRVVYK